MQKNNAALVLGAVLLIGAGAVVVPQLLAEDEVPLVQWNAEDEVEVEIDPAELEGTTALADAERAAVDVSYDPIPSDEPRISGIFRGRVIDKYSAPVAKAEVRFSYSRGGRGRFGGAQRRIPDAVVTDAEGRFAFQGETFRNLRVSLQVVHGKFAPGIFDKDLGEVGAENDLGDLLMAGGGEIIGRVIDVDGNGIAAAEIKLAADGRNSWRRQRNLDEMIPPAQTDNNGYYRLYHVPGAEWRIAATAKMHTEGRSDAFVVEEEQQTQVDDIMLGPGFEVTGYVRDLQSQPIAKARVTLRSTGRERGNADGGGDAGRGRASGRANGRSHSVETDAKGRFFLEHLPGGLMRLEARVDGYLDFTEEEIDPRRGQPIHVTMTQGLRIAGTVLDSIDSQPVTEYAVTATRVRGLPVPGFENVDISSLWQRMRDGNTTEAERREMMTAMQAMRSQFADLGRGRDAGGGRGGRTERGDRGGDRGGERGGRGGRERERNERHPDGTFVVTGLQEGVYEVTVKSASHAMFTSAEIELRAGVASPSLTVRLDRGLYFIGVVVDAHGLPIKAAKVVLRTPTSFENAGRGRGGDNGERGGRGGRDLGALTRDLQRLATGANFTQEVKTDADGEFVFRHVPKGQYRLNAEADGFARSEDADLELLADRSDGKIELGSLGRLVGTVHGLQAGDVGEAQVAAVRVNAEGQGGGGFMRGRGGFERAKVAADGSYTIEGLAAGSYVVRAWVGSQTDIMRQLMPMFLGGELLPDVGVEAGKTTKFDVSVTKPQVGSLIGSVMHNGEAAKGFRIELRRVESDPGSEPSSPFGGRGGRGGRGGWTGQQQATVAGNGTFKIERVTAGEYTLMVRSPEQTTLHQESVWVVADSQTERHLSVQSSRLRGTVTAEAGATGLGGSVQLLAGVTAMPEDLREWRRQPGNTAVNGRINDGQFEIETIPPGSYLMVLSIRGRERSSAAIVVNAGDNETSIAAGAVSTAAPNGATGGNPAGNPAGNAGGRGPGGNGGGRGAAGNGGGRRGR